VRGQARVEDKFLGPVASSFLPELGETQDFIVLLVLAYLGVGVAEDLPVGVAGEKGQDSFLAPAALGT
jgi:hypothetical protein